MSIKTRHEAKKASIGKWNKINNSIIGLLTDIESHCGFCLLAKKNVPKSEGEAYIYKCKYCEPDARRLCEEYIIAYDQPIPLMLREAQEKIYELIKKIKALPDVLKEE